MSKVSRLPASSKFTPEQALLSAIDAAREENATEVIAIVVDRDGDLIIRTSRMTRKDVLWLAEQLRLSALGFD